MRFVAPLALTVCLPLLLAANARADRIELVTGDLITGRIVAETDESITIEHADFGELTIARGRVTSTAYATETAGPAEASAVVLAAPAIQDDADAAAVPSEPAEEKEWSFNLDISAIGTWGNSDEQSVRVGATALRERIDTRLALDAAYYTGVTDGETTDNNFTAGVTHDWLNPGQKWFWFVTGRYDYDQFESWDHRVSFHGGPGYRLVEKEHYTLDLRAGLGTKREWGSDNDSWVFELLFGFDMGWQITERQRAEVTFRYFPTVDDWDNDYRTRLAATWTLKLDPELNLNLLAGVRHEYQNLVDPGDDRNNINAFLGLQLAF